MMVKKTQSKTSKKVYLKLIPVQMIRLRTTLWSNKIKNHSALGAEALLILTPLCKRTTFWAANLNVRHLFLPHLTVNRFAIKRYFKPRFEGNVFECRCFLLGAKVENIV
jgi:hypothetical protein